MYASTRSMILSGNSTPKRTSVTRTMMIVRVTVSSSAFDHQASGLSEYMTEGRSVQGSCRRRHYSSIFCCVRSVGKSIAAVRCEDRLVHEILNSTGCHDAAIETTGSMENKEMAINKIAITYPKTLNSPPMTANRLAYTARWKWKGIPKPAGEAKSSTLIPNSGHGATDSDTMAEYG